MVPDRGSWQADVETHGVHRACCRGYAGIEPPLSPCTALQGPPLVSRALKNYAGGRQLPEHKNSCRSACIKESGTCSRLAAWEAGSDRRYDRPG